MDLTTLITACALTVDPKIMHALIWHQSGGEQWAFSVSGQRQPQVLRNMEDAIGAARGIQPENIAIRVGLAGVPGTPRAVTATTFTPCSNIASAARQIAQFAELCWILLDFDARPYSPIVRAPRPAMVARRMIRCLGMRRNPAKRNRCVDMLNVLQTGVLGVHLAPPRTRGWNFYSAAS